MSQDLEPHVNLNQEHDTAVFQQGLIPDTLYRLRLSVLKDNKGNADCPSQMFNFTSFTQLQEATSNITRTFGGGFSTYGLSKLGVLEKGAGGTEDGRTEDVTLKYDSITADETWEEFLKRVNFVGTGWQTETWNGRKGKLVASKFPDT